jgi:hypothetical protein
VSCALLGVASKPAGGALVAQPSSGWPAHHASAPRSLQRKPPTNAPTHHHAAVGWNRELKELRRRQQAHVESKRRMAYANMMRNAAANK